MRAFRFLVFRFRLDSWWFGVPLLTRGVRYCFFFERRKKDWNTGWAVCLVCLFVFRRNKYWNMGWVFFKTFCFVCFRLLVFCLFFVCLFLFLFVCFFLFVFVFVCLLVCLFPFCWTLKGWEFSRSVNGWIFCPREDRWLLCPLCWRQIIQLSKASGWPSFCCSAKTTKVQTTRSFFQRVYPEKWPNPNRYVVFQPPFFRVNSLLNFGGVTKFTFLAFSHRVIEKPKPGSLLVVSVIEAIMLQRLIVVSWVFPKIGGKPPNHPF